MLKECSVYRRVATCMQNTQVRTHCQFKEGNRLRCSILQYKLDPW